MRPDGRQAEKNEEELHQQRRVADELHVGRGGLGEHGESHHAQARADEAHEDRKDDGERADLDGQREPAPESGQMAQEIRDVEFHLGFGRGVVLEACRVA